MTKVLWKSNDRQNVEVAGYSIFHKDYGYLEDILPYTRSISKTNWDETPTVFSKDRAEKFLLDIMRINFQVFQELETHRTDMIELTCYSVVSYGTVQPEKLIPKTAWKTGLAKVDPRDIVRYRLNAESNHQESK